MGETKVWFDGWSEGGLAQQSDDGGVYVTIRKR